MGEGAGLQAIIPRPDAGEDHRGHMGGGRECAVVFCAMQYIVPYNEVYCTGEGKGGDGHHLDIPGEKAI